MKPKRYATGSGRHQRTRLGENQNTLAARLSSRTASRIPCAQFPVYKHLMLRLLRRSESNPRSGDRPIIRFTIAAALLLPLTVSLAGQVDPRTALLEREG